ncbi:ABC transporter ATP-binding protein [Halobacillus locisalis]|uniref:ABC transporter ATP-binding protein n=1 Tax=Halobacillus locisalis TaxID=220753 RepID=A0A838CUQ7_9BACI|nr:ABC transporter ATP-binding protein [Halobacillus locisalis]MBA2175882.1 ABC transporter ATP-binding protein [Halobacillus locisalis]
MLQVSELKKRYGQKEVVKNVSFKLKEGEAFGLLGPNGAGKSTTIAMICGLVSYDGGQISWHDKPMTSSMKKKVGIVPQEIALYPTMSAKENLLFWGRMYGLKRKEAKKRADDVLDIVGLKDRGKETIETFSGGMKRRINIGAALMHEPELLIMDEPTVGIDPQSRNHILETVKQLNRQGMTMIYTSHYMEEVEFLCDRVGIMDHGEVIASGTQKDLCQRLIGGTVIRLKLEGANESGMQAIQQLASVNQIASDPESNTYEVFVKRPDEAISDIMDTTVEYRMKLSEISVQEPNLESLFLQLTGRSLRD